jgi:SAM-dependent methyltransferase
VKIIWHDLECGSYAADIPLWRALAERYGDPILDIGAGTGRITLDLARRGHRVTALDRDRELLDELERRKGDAEVRTVQADARDFDLGQRFRMCIVPMQTIQLLGGPAGRAEFLRCARRHLVTNGVLAIAISQTLELYDVDDGTPFPLPDICERDGIVYSSQPTAVRAHHGGFVLERKRDVVTADGRQSSTADSIHLDGITVPQLQREAKSAGLSPAGVEIVEPTSDYVGSEVVLFHA